MTLQKKEQQANRLRGGGGKKKTNQKIWFLTLVIDKRQKAMRKSRKIIYMKVQRAFDTEIDDALKRTETFTACDNQNRHTMFSSFQ